MQYQVVDYYTGKPLNSYLFPSIETAKKWNHERVMQNIQDNEVSNILACVDPVAHGYNLTKLCILFNGNASVEIDNRIYPESLQWTPEDIRDVVDAVGESACIVAKV
ncbi:MAG: hypothetical protein WC477_07355 [Patescibacteria group bacterium]